jgi:hypothetical protein
MLRKALLLFGAVYMLLAILGLGLIASGSHHDGGALLFGAFEHDIIHDLVHMVSGITALVVASIGSYKAARLYFQGFGIVYALVAVAGFVQGDTVFNLFAIDMADNLLHVAIAGASLALGFFTKPEGQGTTPTPTPPVK